MYSTQPKPLHPGILFILMIAGFIVGGFLKPYLNPDEPEEKATVSKDMASDLPVAPTTPKK